MAGNRLRVLVSAPYFLPVLPRFRPVLEQAGLGVVVAEVNERLSEKELGEFAGEVDGVLCGDDRFSRPVLEAFSPRLRVISKWGTGIDSIDREAAQAMGIQVWNTPGAFTEAVADTVMGYVLAFARQIPWLDREVKASAWKKKPARSLSECSLGVVGVGRIGQAVLRRARAFDMELHGNDVVEIEPQFLDENRVHMTTLEDLLGRCDFVSLNCDLNPGTRHLLNRARFAALKPGAVLINTARGGVIDEAALVEALRSAHVGGAALDVFEEEPLPQSSPLRGMPNVLLAPHNANASPRAWEKVHIATLGNLLRGLGLPLPPEWGDEAAVPRAGSL